MYYKNDTSAGLKSSPLLPLVLLALLLCSTIPPGVAAETATPETATPETAASETVAPETVAPETVAPETASSVEEEPTPEELLRKSISLDIDTSSYYELQTWLLRLGMNTAGTKGELRTRLLSYYERELGGIPASPGEETKETDKSFDRMEIKSAGTLDYFRDERESQVLRIGGGVVLNMADTESDTVHTVEARSLVFNRDIDSITASGDVFYRMEKGGSVQEFEGDEISFNIENYRGVFVQGISRRPRTIEGETVLFYFRGDTIYRIRKDTIRLEAGIISSSRMEKPYYRISAGNVWILGLNEWALRDAVLYIGHIPVFYVPFFFKRGDTFVLHPSIGMRSIEGYYAQTTTYFLGRKQETEDDEGIFSFLQAVDEDKGRYSQELQGLFIHGTREPIQENWINRSGSYGKIMFDYYSRLGILTGMRISLSDLGNFKRILLTAGLGVTNYIYTLPGYSENYTSFFYDADGDTYTINPQEPYVMGTRMPLRFGFDFELSYSRKNFSFETGLPFYTDLLLRDQLTKRNEELGWSKLITGEGIQDTDSFDDFENPKFFQHTKFRLSRLEKLKFLDTFSFDKVDSQLAFSQSNLEEDQNAFNKLGYYYPQLFTPLNLELTIKGTLFKSGGAGNSGNTERDQGNGENAEDSWTLPAEARSPSGAEVGDKIDRGDSAVGRGSPEGEESEGGSEDRLQYKVPEKSGDIKLAKRKVELPFSHSLGYSVSPDYSYHTRMDTDSMSGSNPENVDFDPLYSYILTDGSSSLQYNAKMFDGLLSFSQTTRLNGRYRDHFDGENLEELIEQDRSLSYLNVLGVAELKNYFLKGTTAFKKSYLLYSVEGDLFNYSYNDEIKSFESQLPEWDEEGINRQKSELILLYDRWEATQKLQFSYSMPPQMQAFDILLSLKTGVLKSAISLNLDETEKDKWETGPLKITETLNYENGSYFEQNLTLFQPGDTDNTGLTKVNLKFIPGIIELYGSLDWNISEKRSQTGIGSLKLGWWTNRYEMRYMDEYEFEDSSWNSTGDTSFQPYLFSSTLKIPYGPDPLWKNRVRFDSSLSTSLQFNFIRYNESFFQFSWEAELKIEEFLLFKFNIKSENNAMYRYIAAFSEELGKEALNLGDDLWSSFDFSDRTSRLRSNFNLQSISFSMVHYMRDWELNMRYSGAPELDENNVYEWRSEFSIFVQWKPIPEVRKQVDYIDEELQF